MSRKRKSTTSAKRANRPPRDSTWVWATQEMMESPAWHAINTLSARRVLDCIQREHMNHGGTENGNLIVTYADFIKHGVRKKSITSAIAVLEALGWIDITSPGKQAVEGERYPARYALTWLEQPSLGKPATNRWRYITTPAAARAVVKQALDRREAKRDQSAARGRKGQKRNAQVPALQVVAVNK
jgi:hypothetical protein